VDECVVGDVADVCMCTGAVVMVPICVGSAGDIPAIVCTEGNVVIVVVVFVGIGGDVTVVCVGGVVVVCVIVPVGVNINGGVIICPIGDVVFELFKEGE
jgi:hypothetical protein